MAFKKIVCCIDFSKSADAAFAIAVELAEKDHAKLWILHILPPPINPIDAKWDVPDHPKEAIVLQLQERMQQEYGDQISASVPYELVVLDGHISTEILKFLEKNPVDLCVMGAYGMTSMGLVIFGSIAKRVSHRAPCSVMIIRS
jgi:universal stress protein A